MTLTYPDFESIMLSDAITDNTQQQDYIHILSVYIVFTSHAIIAPINITRKKLKREPIDMR